MEEVRQGVPAHRLSGGQVQREDEEVPGGHLRSGEGDCASRQQVPSVTVMHWDRRKPVSVLYFSNSGLGQAPTPTELAPHPVQLGSSKLPAIISWGLVLGIIGFAVVRSNRAQRVSAGPDAPTLLAREVRRIQRRQQRRKVTRKR